MKRWSFCVESSEMVSTVTRISRANVVIVVDMSVSSDSWETSLVKISNPEKIYFS